MGQTRSVQGVADLVVELVADFRSSTEEEAAISGPGETAVRHDPVRPLFLRETPVGKVCPQSGCDWRSTCADHVAGRRLEYFRTKGLGDELAIIAGQTLTGADQTLDSAWRVGEHQG